MMKLFQFKNKIMNLEINEIFLNFYYFYRIYIIIMKFVLL